MSNSEKPKAHQHALNLFISWELKQALQQTAKRFDRTVADIVRISLKLSLPILRGACESQEELGEQLAILFGRLPEPLRKDVAAADREV